LANVVRHFAVDSGSTLFATAVMTVLIFGGCCSNVCAASLRLYLLLVR
jgi:UDP-xylose/UDP-N-acetylglucosamine transporter B4